LANCAASYSVNTAISPVPQRATTISNCPLLLFKSAAVIPYGFEPNPVE
jgi:hypothetical protein